MGGRVVEATVLKNRLWRKPYGGSIIPPHPLTVFWGTVFLGISRVSSVSVATVAVACGLVRSLWRGTAPDFAPLSRQFTCKLHRILHRFHRNQGVSKTCLWRERRGCSVGKVAVSNLGVMPCRDFNRVPQTLNHYMQWMPLR